MRRWPADRPGWRLRSQRLLSPVADAVSTDQRERLDKRSPAAGARHSEANMASIDR